MNTTTAPFAVKASFKAGDRTIEIIATAYPKGWHKNDISGASEYRYNICFDHNAPGCDGEYINATYCITPEEMAARVAKGYVFALHGNSQHLANTLGL
jgi:hypothetical protein